VLSIIPDVSVDRSSSDAREVMGDLRDSAPYRQQALAVANATRESFESEMTLPAGSSSRRVPPLSLSHISRPTDSSYPRESSQTTVNVQKSSQTGESSSGSHPQPYTPPPALPQNPMSPRESNLLEITEEEVSGGYLARSVIAPGVYYLGIIDILQKWTWEKKLERCVELLLPLR
jgi:hypothetical protein